MGAMSGAERCRQERIWKLETWKAAWGGLVPSPSILSSCIEEDVRIASAHIACWIIFQVVVFFTGHGRGLKSVNPL